jgi:hypothetical protein
MKIDRQTFKVAYKSFIRPIMEYGDVVWDNNKIDDHSLDQLEQVNVNAARLVCGATARSHLDRLYEENQWEKLCDRRKAHRLTVFYKMAYGQAPLYLLNVLPNPVASRTHHNLRNKNDLQIPYSRVNVHKNSFLPATVEEWNSLDSKIKESPSISAFKRALSKCKKKPPPHFYAGNRHDSAHHCRMRLGCSALKYDLCMELKVIPSSTCACGGGPENANHYLYECPIYATQRTSMMENLYKIGKFNLAILLSGSDTYSNATNCKIFQCVQNFIMETKRFS